jgi:(2Fe-2S) ferredoxin
MDNSQTSSNDSLASDASLFTDLSSNVHVIQGTYLGGLSSSKGRLKYLQLQQNGEEWLVKLSKPIGYTLAGKLQPGMVLQVWARPKDDCFKALKVIPVAPGISEQAASSLPCKASIAPAPEEAAGLASLPEGTTVTPKPKACTLKVCTKGKCDKQGSHKVLMALKAAIAQSAATSHIIIKPTGCLKNCKQGPTVKVSPGSETYSFVRPQDAPTLVRHHRSH